MVLRKASELDESEGGGPSTGLSQGELIEIAREVGISAGAIDRAVAGLDRGRELGPVLAGAPLVRKAVHAVPSELDERAIARLIQLIDERTDTAGTVSEALGSVRWTSSDRFKSTRVSITAAGGQTSIEVVEKALPRMRRIFHLLPAAWATMIAAPIIGALQLSATGSIAAVVLSLAAGAGIGRAVWSVLSAASGRRVRRLAEGLASEGYEASRLSIETDEPLT